MVKAIFVKMAVLFVVLSFVIGTGSVSLPSERSVLFQAQTAIAAEEEAHLATPASLSQRFREAGKEALEAANAWLRSVMGKYKVLTAKPAPTTAPTPEYRRLLRKKGTE